MSEAADRIAFRRRGAKVPDKSASKNASAVATISPMEIMTQNILKQHPALQALASHPDFSKLVALYACAEKGMKVTVDQNTALPTIAFPAPEEHLTEVAAHFRKKMKGSWPVPGVVDFSLRDGGELGHVVQNSAWFKNLRLAAVEMALRTRDPEAATALMQCAGSSTTTANQGMHKVARAAAKGLLCAEVPDLAEYLPHYNELADSRYRPGAVKPSFGLAYRGEEVRDRLRWVLAIGEADGDLRRQKSARRWEAMRIYGSVVTALMKPEVTAAIDAATELNPILRGALRNIPRPALDTLRHARPVMDVLVSESCYTQTARRMAYFDIKLQDYPKDASGWVGNPFSTRNELTTSLIRDDYHPPKRDAEYLRGQEPNDPREEFQDALQAVWRDTVMTYLSKKVLQAIEADERQDIWEPVLRHGFTRSLNSELNRWPNEIRPIILAFQRAIVGTRKPETVAKALARAHSYSASIEAVRLEGVGKGQKGWPAMCAPWTSANGAYELVPLTQAKDLVEEGLTMHHCVGSYYEKCLQGRTQILSLRENGRRVATVEVEMPGKFEDAEEFKVVQFAGFANKAPDAQHKLALKEAMSDIRRGAHAIDVAALYAFAQRRIKGKRQVAEKEFSYAGKVFPIYRETVLFGVGGETDIDTWLKRSGIGQAVDEAIPLLRQGLLARAEALAEGRARAVAAAEAEALDETEEDAPAP